MEYPRSTCQQCGQPLMATNPDRYIRSDRAFCSNRCKMRAHRAKQKAVADAARQASQQQLLIKRSRPVFRAPVLFGKAESGQARLEGDFYYVDPLDWREAMGDLNRLHGLWDAITSFTELQGETSKNTLLEDLSDDEGNDWCAYFEGQLSDPLLNLEARLLTGTPALQTYLAAHQIRIHDWIVSMLEAARFFVYTHHRQQDPFIIHFEESLIVELKQAHRLVVGWWFEYEASIP